MELFLHLDLLLLWFFEELNQLDRLSCLPVGSYQDFVVPFHRWFGISISLFYAFAGHFLLDVKFFGILTGFQRQENGWSNGWKATNSKKRVCLQNRSREELDVGERPSMFPFISLSQS